MSQHIAQEAMEQKLHKGACNACDKGAVKRNLCNCRGSDPLNGHDAAMEYTRGLLPAVRSRLIARDAQGRNVL